jgi:DNA-binding transcriptional ArsR family regulator
MAALASPIRREILGLIWDRELPATEIAEAFHLTKPTISQHLSVLREAGLVKMTPSGTSRRYRARKPALAGLQGALEGSTKWTPADGMPDEAAADAATRLVVVAAVDVDTDQATTFAALTDPEVYSRWLGVPVTIRDERFAATMEWGTEVRGRYVMVTPPSLIVMQWDFDDNTVPVPGAELTGYLWVHPRSAGSRVEVHQLAHAPNQASFMEIAWTTVLGRLQANVVAASQPDVAVGRRARRTKRRSSA